MSDRSDGGSRCEYCLTRLKYQRLNATILAAACRKRGCVYNEHVHIKTRTAVLTTRAMR